MSGNVLPDSGKATIPSQGIYFVPQARIHRAVFVSGEDPGRITRVIRFFCADFLITLVGGYKT